MKLKHAVILAWLALLSGVPASAQTPMAWTEPHSGIEFIRIDQGCFPMGTDYPGAGIPGERPAVPSPNETPRHQVCLDGFWLGKLEVTRAQWQRIMAPTSPADGQGPQLPALNVTWEEAQEFLRRLNAQAGGKDARVRYRLPTEAEWEYACRAGDSADPDPDLLDGVAMTNRLLAVAWYQEPRRRDAAARNAGEMGANAWGLHDMLGNAAEWVQDDFMENAYARHPRLNPLATQDSTRKAIRGGSFKSDPWSVRCGARNYSVPGDRLPTVGLRIARTGEALR